MGGCRRSDNADWPAATHHGVQVHKMSTLRRLVEEDKVVIGENEEKC